MPDQCRLACHRGCSTAPSAPCCRHPAGVPVRCSMPNRSVASTPSLRPGWSASHGFNRQSPVRFTPASRLRKCARTSEGGRKPPMAKTTSKTRPKPAAKASSKAAAANAPAKSVAWIDDGTAIFVGKSSKPEVLTLSLANRHGLVTGATGTGKTVTLQVLAEGFSRAGVPVFAADVKGDLSGIAAPGEAKEAFVNRAKEVGITYQ